MKHMTYQEALERVLLLAHKHIRSRKPGAACIETEDTDKLAVHIVKDRSVDRDTTEPHLERH